MAEVKQTSGSFSLPLKKKPPSFNTNGASTSFKHIYDDVFGSSPSSNVKTSSSFMEDDYAEIFGSSKSNNGSWSIPYSSVPILDLPRDKGVVFKGERVDYGGIFSSFDNGVGDDEGLPDGEELINQLKKKAKTSSLNNFPRSHGRSTEATKLESPSQSYDDQLPDNGFSQSFENMKHPQPVNDNLTEKAASRTRKATHVRNYSFHEPVIRDEPPNTYPSMGGKLANHCRHTSLDLGAQSCKTNAGLQKSSGISVSNIDTSNGTSQPSKAAINGFYESSDNTNNSENYLNEMSNNKNRGEIHVSEVHPIPEPTFSLREARPTSDIKPIHESDHSLKEQDSTQETVFNKTSVLNEPQFTKDVNLMEEQKKHSRNTSLELSSKLNDNYDGVFQRPSGLTESMSADNSHEACEASCASGPSHMVKDDVSVDSPKVKKKGRRSRMASVDLGDYKHSSERDDGHKRKPRFAGSYSFDASHDPCASRVRVHPSMMHPSSSLPRFFPVESHYKISENSTGKRSQTKWDGGASDSPPSLIEELDVNSDAAISAAVLQKAIEEAELRIRMAKAFLEREGQGCTKRSFKDTLKVRVERENGLVNEVHKIKQTKLHDWCPPVVDSEQKEHCSTSDRKLHDCSPPVVDSQQNEHCSPLDRNHAGETTQRASIGEDVKKFIEDTNLADREDVKVTNSITGDDKREGEWEAAKHINQLISGVKNKLASFISWQTETEKKEVVKEMEETMKAQQQLEENEHDSKDRETFKRKRTEHNEVTSTSSSEAAQEDKKPQFVSEPVKSEVNQSVNSFNVKQDKPENRIDSNIVTTNLANFQFFAFRNQKVSDSSDPEVEEIEPLETKESQTVNGREHAIDEVEINCTPSVVEEASQEESDDKSVIEDSKRQDDTSQTHDAGLQNDKEVEKSCFLADHNIEELSVEDLCQGKMIGKDEVCAISRENVEMVEKHCSMARNDIMEPSHEEDEQDYMSGNSCLSSVNEENDELVEQPSSFAAHDEKELPFEEDRQDGMYKFNHLSSGNEETEMEVCNQAGLERNDADHEVYNRSSTEKSGDEPTDHSYLSGDISVRTAKGNLGMQEEAKYQHEKVKLLKETWKTKTFESSTGDHECQEEDNDQRETNHFEELEQTYGGEDIKQVEEQNELIKETAEKVNVQEGSVASADEGCVLDDNVSLCKTEEARKIDGTSSEVEEVYWEEELERMDFSSTTEPEINVQTPGSVLKSNGLLDEELPASAQKSSELKEEEPSESIRKPVELIGEEPVTSSLSTETEMELEKNEIKDGVNGTIGDLEHENSVSLDRELDLSTSKKDADMKAVDHSESQYNMDVRTLYLHEPGENLHMGEDSVIDLDAERSSVEAFHRRRRWFDHGGTVLTAERPSILEGKGIELENTKEVLDESEIAGSVEIHADKLASDATTARDADASSNPDIARTETTPTRKKWFVREGKPEPVSLFEDIKVNLEIPLERMNESGVAVDGEKGKQSGETAPRRRRWFESGERGGTSQQAKVDDDVGLNGKIDQESKAKVDEEQLGNHDGIPIPQEKNDVYEKEKPEKEYRKDLDEVHKRGKEREKERLAVERAIREARERAFAEAKERARRETTDRLNMEARPKVAAGVQEKLGKVSSEATSSSDKAFMEAKLKAERAAVERATAEARERALQKALSDKGSHRPREPAGIYSFERNSSMESKNQSSRGSDSSNNNEKVEGAYVESPQRRKARLERQTRTIERATKALEEKNRRDLLAQKEQIAKNMMSESLDAEVKRWCTGKEGNLRALLSTLQYVLGPESGWQPVSLTDLVASTAVRKAYKKATLCVHPDKLQQRGASIQQKYICEKVFDLLKDAWSKFHPDER